MKTAERTRIAFERGTPDRVPIHCWLGLPLIRELKPKDKTMTDMLEWWIDDPMGSIVKMQQDLGLDPMITTYSQHIGEHEIWPRMLFPRPFETDTWVETFHVSARARAGASTRHDQTPDGDLDYTYRTEDGFGTSCHDYLLKGDEPETKLAALRALPVRRPLRHVGHAGHGREGRRRGLVAAPRDRPVGHGGRGARARQPLDGHLRPARSSCTT